MDKISASAAKQTFGDVLDAAQFAPVTIVRHGRAVAVVARPDAIGESRTAERRVARLTQQLVDRDRLLRHYRIAQQLLTLPAAKSLAMVRAARKEVDRWETLGLCSRDYIGRWRKILALPATQLAEALVSDHEGWGTALRQNSPWANSA